jgi:type II secretory pathway pseudopilin PulG
MRLRRRFFSERSESGETLLELMISCALMGLVAVGIMGGLATSVLGAHVHREQASANTVLVSAMERIKSSDFDFSNVDCTKTASGREDAYEAAARSGASMPTGWPASSLAVSDIQFEKLVWVAGVPNVSFATSCVTGLRRQLVTLTLTTPDGRVGPSLSFVKGDV